MRRGLRTGLGTVVALVAAAVGIYIATKISSAGIKSYTLQETPPEMVSDFGPKARVVQISTSDQNVDFQVIRRRGRAAGQSRVLSRRHERDPLRRLVGAGDL
jgi:hypothetical protein